MNWSDEQKTQLQKELKNWLAVAFDELESAVILLENEKFQHSCQFLQNSVRALLKGCCVLQGQGLPQTDQEALETFHEFNHQMNWIKEPLITVPQKVLQLDDTTLKDKKVVREYDWLSEQHQALLYQIQHRLNQLMKHELATPYDRVRFAKQKKQFQLKLATVMLGVGIVWGGLYWTYFLLKPLHVFEGQGQIFWNSSVVKDFSEEFQKAFRIKADGNFIDYKISFEKPIPINRMRLDPIDRQITTVELDQMVLQNAEGKTIYVFNFDSGDSPWTRRNVQASEASKGTWKLKPQTHDPFIISETFPEQTTSHILIKMRLSDRLSFLGWLFGVGS